MTDAEIVRWTAAMIDSCERMDFFMLAWPTVDQHFTGFATFSI